MIKKLAWNTFKNTGDIKTFLEFKRIEELECNLDYTKNTNEQIEIGKQVKNNIKDNNKIL